MSDLGMIANAIELRKAAAEAEANYQTMIRTIASDPDTLAYLFMIVDDVAKVKRESGDVPKKRPGRKKKVLGTSPLLLISPTRPGSTNLQSVLPEL